MPTVVGIFDNQMDAGDAVNDLDALGLEEDSIRVITRRSVERSDSLLGSLARAFTGGDSPITSGLTEAGLSAEEAEFYEQEMDEESVLVVVEAEDEHYDGVMDIMQRSQATMRE